MNESLMVAELITPSSKTLYPPKDVLGSVRGDGARCRGSFAASKADSLKGSESTHVLLQYIEMEKGGMFRKFVGNVRHLGWILIRY